MKNRIIILLITCFLFSCYEKEENLEENVFNDIFIQLAEKMRLSVTEIYPLPPLPALNERNLDSLKQDLKLYTEILDDYSVYLRSYYFYNNTINSDSLKVKIGINDTLKSIDIGNISERYSNNEYLKQNPEFEKLIFQKIKTPNTSKIINLKYLIEHKPFEIIKTSKLGWKEELRNNFQDNKDYYLSGVLDLSRVYFNNEKNIGYFMCSEIANHYEIFIQLILVRKVNEKWRIVHELYLR